MERQVFEESRVDEGKLWECVLDERSGKPRLSKAVSFFSPLIQGKIPLLYEAFQYWRDFTEYLVLPAKNRRTGEVRAVAVLAAKRGNVVYSNRVEKRLGFLKRDENIEFFSLSDFKNFKKRSKVKTRLLWATLTYDSKLCDLHTAWLNVAAEFNRWITNLRQRYGRIWYVSFVQAFPGSGSAFGYPHFHVIMLFEDTEFKVHARFEESEGKKEAVFRIGEKYEFEDAGRWHSFVDVKAVKSVKALFYYTRKYCKNTIQGKGSEATINACISWLYRKRAFNVSGKFREMYHDLIRAMRNSKVFQSDLFGVEVKEWVFTCLGVFSASEIGVNGKDPPWFVLLSKEDLDRLAGLRSGGQRGL